MSGEDLLRAVAHQRQAHNLQIRSFPVPGAGNEFVITVPGHEDWRLLAVTTALTTSAVAGNRLSSLSITDQTLTACLLPIGQVVGPSASVFLSWVADLGMGPLPAGLPTLAGSIPPIVLPGGWRIASATSARDVADAYGSINVMFEMLNEPPHLSPTTGTALEEQIHDALQMQREGAM